MRAKNTACYADSARGNSLFEAFDQWFGKRRGRGIGETWSASPAHISIQGELRDDQRFPTDVEERAVHLPFVVFKDAQVDDFLAEDFDLCFAVMMSNAQKDEESMTNGADNLLIDGDAGMGDTLK